MHCSPPPTRVFAHSCAREATRAQVHHAQLPLPSLVTVHIKSHRAATTPVACRTQVFLPTYTYLRMRALPLLLTTSVKTHCPAAVPIAHYTRTLACPPLLSCSHGAHRAYVLALAYPPPRSLPSASKRMRLTIVHTYQMHTPTSPLRVYAHALALTIFVSCSHRARACSPRLHSTTPAQSASGSHHACRRVSPNAPVHPPSPTSYSPPHAYERAYTRKWRAYV